MNKIIVIIFFFIIIQPSYSQGDKIVYFNADFETTATAKDYHILGERNYNKKGIGQTVYYRKDQSKFGAFDEKKGKKNGGGVYYHENNEVARKGNFKNDKPIGIHDYYDVSAVYVRSEIYNQRGKIIAEFYKTKSEKKIFTICDRLSSFGKKRNESKAFAEMGVFIDENLIRPLISRELDEATVTVAFLIAPDGTLEELEIVQSVHPELNKNVMAVMTKMPNWRPAKFKHNAVYSEFSITVNL